MKSVRKLVLRGLERVGLVDGIGPIKGPLAAKTAMDTIRPAIQGLSGHVVQKFKGKNICRVKIRVGSEHKTYDAIITNTPSRKAVGHFKTPVEGGFNVGDEVFVLGWDGLSQSQIEVVPIAALRDFVTKDTVSSLLYCEGVVIDKFNNYFCKVKVQDFELIAKYQGTHAPRVGEKIKITSTIGVQLICESTE